MKWIILTLFIFFCNTNAWCQRLQPGSANYFYSGWDSILSNAVKVRGLTSDSVYFCQKAQKNSDSALVVAIYFDGDGNVVEKDEFNMKTGATTKITNYTWVAGLLIKEESLSKSTMIINDGPALDKQMTTFEYDSAGNLVTQKQYAYFNDSLKNSSTTESDLEHDSLGNTIKEYTTLPGGIHYLYRAFTYTNGDVTNEQVFDTYEHLMYSYEYEYDKKAHTRDCYMVNTAGRTHKEENFLDDHGRLVKRYVFSKSNLYWDRITFEFGYDGAGLLVTQSIHTPNAKDVYLKHYYNRKKS